MGKLVTSVFFVFCWGSLVEQGWQQQPQVLERFEYKHSFKPPYLAQKDGSVPFFDYSGNAIASEESVRITPSLRSQKGMIWNRIPLSSQWWKVEMHFRVTGRGRVGADGLAFWYTSQRGTEGPVFGSSDKWNGLAVFFDSFDNDNKHNNPHIMAMGNDGTIAYDHQNDGMTQQLGGCLRDFRNKPFPVRAKIEYLNHVLTVMIHNGMSNNENDYEVCLRVENVHLPSNGYFGISAATGGLADDHDVLRFLVWSLHPSDAGIIDNTPDAESKKFEEEFQEYQKKLKEEKEKWAAENPDQAKNMDTEDWNNWFSESDKELQQIFQGQNSIRDSVNNLHRKMDEIIGRQERLLSLVSAGGGGGGGAAAGNALPAPQGGGIPVDTIRRDEVNAVLANQREVVSVSRDIKNFVTDIHSKTNQLLNRGSSQPIGGDIQSAIQEVKDSLHVVKRDMNVFSQRACPEVSGGSCVSTTVFIVLIVVQLIILISYLMYRDSKEAQAKKFY